jgi:hypothetical protein
LGLFNLAYVHGMPYTGENWTKEREELENALADLEIHE